MQTMIEETLDRLALSLTPDIKRVISPEIANQNNPYAIYWMDQNEA